MCTPKITPRPQRVIRVEFDPYRRDRDRLNLGPIVRKIYEDGSHALYVGDNHVWAIRYTGDYFLDDTIIELGFADGTTSVRFSEASPGGCLASGIYGGHHMSTPKIVSRPGPKITPNTHYDQDGYPQLVHPLKPIKDYALKDEFTQLDAPVNLLWDEVWDKYKDHIALREGEEVPTVTFKDWTWVDENKEDHHI